MKYGSCLAVAISLFCSPVVADAQQYLCVVERAVGFAYKSNSWENAHFKTENKYIISKGDGKGYKVTKVGDKNELVSCEKDFNEFGYLFCSGLPEFKFNKNNGRFLLAYLLGYYNVLPQQNKITDENSDTPYLEIGRCSPF